MKKMTVILGMGLASVAQAINIQVGQPLPPVSLSLSHSDGGELVITDETIQPISWDSQNLVGKVRVVQHMAGRSSVKEKNDPLMNAIKKVGFKAETYQTTNIINVDDAIIGTSYFVKSSAEKAKKENAHSQVILDNAGKVREAWGLRPNESFIAVLNKEGIVEFFFEGKLNPQQISTILTTVHELQGKQRFPSKP